MIHGKIVPVEDRMNVIITDFALRKHYLQDQIFNRDVNYENQAFIDVALLLPSRRIDNPSRRSQASGNKRT